MTCSSRRGHMMLSGAGSARWFTIAFVRGQVQRDEIVVDDR
jgi:hypothetical protein